MKSAESLSTIIACLNATCLALLIWGRVAIRRGDQTLHRKLMVSAVCVSAVFLVVYLARVSMTGTTYFPGTGWRKGLYLFILFSHMPLAALVVPLCLRALWLALKRRFAEHRRVVRWLWPIWSYVSVTGVLVYFMLHHWHGA